MARLAPAVKRSPSRSCLRSGREVSRSCGCGGIQNQRRPAAPSCGAELGLGACSQQDRSRHPETTQAATATTSAEMSRLILKPASVSRPSGQWRDDDYDVLENGVVAGSIFKTQVAPADRSWMWASGQCNQDAFFSNQRASACHFYHLRCPNSDYCVPSKRPVCVMPKSLSNQSANAPPCGGMQVLWLRLPHCHRYETITSRRSAVGCRWPAAMNSRSS
jgi:hypothetical protein